MKYKYLICIPTYNEAENIRKLLPKISQQNLNNTDILIIDDNSPDGTSKLAKQISSSKKLKNKVFVLDRKSKEGLGKAYVAGFKWALSRKYDYIFSMDADFSHDPKYLFKMIAKSPNYDVVIGSRYVKGGKIVGWEWFRYVNSYGANFITRLILGLRPKDATAGFKCYNAKFLRSIDLDKIIAGGYAFQVEMINLAQEGGFTMTEIPITFADRRAGESKISGELSRSAQAVFQLAKKKKIYREIVKFGIVGLVGTVIDIGIYNFLIFGAGLASMYVARTISFIASASNNYILNRKWTFRSQEKRVARQFTQFFIVSLIGLGLNLIIMASLQGLVYNIQNEILKKNIPVVIAIVIVFIWNYFINKYWTFRKK
jgi:dolichol-phosphate mannosyltransferase